MATIATDNARPKASLSAAASKAILALGAWVAVYFCLDAASKAIAFGLLNLNPKSQIGSAVQFFIFEVPKVLMLLLLVVYGVGIVRSFFSADKTRKLLAGKRVFAGNVMAASLGTVTPFCSCSAVPLFIGFVQCGVPLGVTLSFLIAAPMVNEVAIVLLASLFGIKVAALYVSTGLALAILAGWIIGKLKLERFVESWVFELQAGDQSAEEKMTWQDRHVYAKDAVKTIVGKVWPYIVAGVGVGAWIHGFVPVNTMAGIMGKDAWWSVPLAVLLGVPMYSNAAGIIPIVQALLEKGASLGTVLAFMMAVIGLSLPETIILRKVLKPQLIAIFVAVVALGILIVGYLFNAVL